MSPLSSLSLSLLVALPLLAPVPAAPPCDGGPSPSSAIYEVTDSSGTLLGHLTLNLNGSLSGGFWFQFDPVTEPSDTARMLEALLSGSQTPYDQFITWVMQLELVFLGSLIEIGPPEQLPPLSDLILPPHFGPTVAPLIEGYLDVDTGGALIVPFGGKDHAFALGNPQFTY